MAFAVENLSKSYAGVPVLKGVDLSVADGEIHALLGANGAGKSTLIKCMSGAEQPSGGTIVIGDERYSSLNPKEGHRAGVAVIHQEPSLALSLNLTENIFLGEELTAGPFVRRRAQEAEAKHWLARLGVNIAPRASLTSLGNAELQVVEIVKALRRKPQLLILDEPTASLTEDEARQLAEHMLALKDQQMPMLYVTHRLHEVFELADRVTVLRGGEIVLSGPVKSFSRAELVSAIVGRTLDPTSARRAQATDAARAPVMRVRGLVAAGVGPLDLDLHSGEILGVFGLVGSGRTELLETAFGARQLHGGSIEVNDRPLNLRRPAVAVANGIALVPSDRLRKSVLAELSAIDNTLLPSFRRLARFGIRRRGAEREAFDGAAAGLNLQPRRTDLEARRFSGGNQQKLVLARWLGAEQQCHVLLLDEPTQGVDVGARRELYDALRAFARPGRGVIVTSSEPEELLQLAHRVLVLSRGRLVGTLRGDEISEQRLLDLAHFQEHAEAA